MSAGGSQRNIFRQLLNYYDYYTGTSGYGNSLYIRPFILEVKSVSASLQKNILL